MTLVDHHCHLDFPDFADELDGVIARAKTAGVGLMVTISTAFAALIGCCRLPMRTPTSSVPLARIRTTPMKNWMCRWTRSYG